MHNFEEKKMDEDWKEMIVRQREGILQGIVALVERAAEDTSLDAVKNYRAKAESEIRNLREADKTIAYLTPPPKSLYIKSESAIDAVLAFLSYIRHPVPAQQIADDASKEGGWLDGGEKVAHRIKQSIAQYVNATNGTNPKAGSMAGKIKEVNGRIGLYEWPNEMFE